MQTIIENGDFICFVITVFSFGLMIGYGIAPNKVQSNSDNS